MHILIAEDDPVCRRALEAALGKSGLAVEAVADGAAAWLALQRHDGPRLAVLDWMMPVIDGVDLCRQIRATPRLQPTYLILLTARDSHGDVISGLQAGADDYITKPFDPAELQARVQVGMRVAALQEALAQRVADLEEALSRVKQLRGLLPICAYCKNIRDDRNYWQQVETYVSEHSDAQFSHGICPTCYEKFVTPAIHRDGTPVPDPT